MLATRFDRFEQAAIRQAWPEDAADRARPRARGSQAARISLCQDQEVFAQEAPVGRIYRVRSGTVRTVRLLSDGRRQLGAFCFPGDWFGLEADARHHFAAEAVNAVVLEAYDRSALAGDSGFGRELMAAAVAELSRAHDHALLLGRKTAEEKVATFLWDLHCRGIRELPMRRQDIADYLGLTIETVSRMLTHLQKAGVVQIARLRQFRVLDSQALALRAA